MEVTSARDLKEEGGSQGWGQDGRGGQWEEFPAEGRLKGANRGEEGAE